MNGKKFIAELKFNKHCSVVIAISRDVEPSRTFLAESKIEGAPVYGARDRTIATAKKPKENISRTSIHSMTHW